MKLSNEFNPDNSNSGFVYCKFTVCEFWVNDDDDDDDDDDLVKYILSVNTYMNKIL